MILRCKSAPCIARWNLRYLSDVSLRAVRSSMDTRHALPLSIAAHLADKSITRQTLTGPRHDSSLLITTLSENVPLSEPHRRTSPPARRHGGPACPSRSSMCARWVFLAESERGLPMSCGAARVAGRPHGRTRGGAGSEPVLRQTTLNCHALPSQKT
jgi:hypothetical protein